MPTSARCWDFGIPSVGADDPGGPTPRPPRLPCVKGAVARRATEGLSGVDGPFGGDLCLALLSARALFHTNSRWFLNTSPPRRGGPMCPPRDTSVRDPPTGRHIGRPLPGRWKPPSPLKQRAGTEPRPYRSIAVRSAAQGPSGNAGGALCHRAAGRTARGVPWPQCSSVHWGGSFFTAA